MAIGVTYEEFWYGDPEIVEYAIEVESIRGKREAIAADLNAWNTGRYVMLAVGTVLSQAFSNRSSAKYPPEPLLGPELDEALATSKRERELQQQHDRFVAMAKALSGSKTTGEVTIQ